MAEHAQSASRAVNPLRRLQPPDPAPEARNVENLEHEAFPQLLRPFPGQKHHSRVWGSLSYQYLVHPQITTSTIGPYLCLAAG